MNADTLVNLLLEVSILNVNDIDREIARLAAGVYDERGQTWLKRVARYWVLNVDKLVSEPYAMPSGKVPGSMTPWPPNLAFQSAPGEQPVAQQKLAGFYQQAGINPKSPNARFRLRDWAAKQPKKVQAEVDNALTQGSEVPRSNLAKGVLSQHAPVGNRMVEPYTTGFHPFKSAQAKKALPTQKMSGQKGIDPAKHALLGDPPSKQDMPGYVKGGEEGGEQFYHFDPIQARQRELWVRLQDVANWFNHMSKRSEDKGQRFFNGLSRMPAEDLDGFRNVLNSAIEWKEGGATGRITGEDEEVLAQLDDLTLIQVTQPETAHRLGMLPVPAANNPTGRPRESTNWCTRLPQYDASYIAGGPLFDVFKNGAPYVQFHLHGGGGLNDVNDRLIQAGDPIIDEIAPLLANFPWPDAVGSAGPLKAAALNYKRAHPNIDTSPGGNMEKLRSMGNLAAEFMDRLQKGKLPEAPLEQNVKDYLHSKGQTIEDATDFKLLYNEVIRRIGNLGVPPDQRADSPRRPYRIRPGTVKTEPGPPMSDLAKYYRRAGINPIGPDGKEDPKALEKLRDWAARKDKAGDYLVGDEDRADIDSLFTRARPRSHSLRAIFGESRARRLIQSLA